MLVHHVVLALAFREIDPRHAVVAGEPVHRGAERVGDLGQWCGGGDRQAQLPMYVGHQSRRVLQAGHIRIQIHAVNAVHREDHVLGHDIAEQIALPSSLGSDRTGGRQRPTNRYDGSYTGPDIRSRSHPDRLEPPSTDRPQACLVGLGRSPVSLSAMIRRVTTTGSDGTAPQPVTRVAWAARRISCPLTDFDGARLRGCSVPRPAGVLVSMSRSASGGPRLPAWRLHETGAIDRRSAQTVHLGHEESSSSALPNSRVEALPPRQVSPVTTWH